MCSAKPWRGWSPRGCLRQCPTRADVDGALKRFSVEMNRDDKLLAVYPPHPEEGASTCTFEKRNHRVAPVSKDGRPHGSRCRARGCGIWADPKLRLLTMRPREAASASN